MENKFEEYVVGEVERSKGSRILVTVMRAERRNVFVTIANQYKRKDNEWFDKRKVYIPISSREQVEILLSLAKETYEILQTQGWEVDEEEYY